MRRLRISLVGHTFRFASLVAALLLSCAAPKPYQITNFFLNKDALSDLRAKRVAVLEFKNLSSHPKAGLKVADEFNLQLGKLGKFELVERERIQELFKEQDLDPKRIDPSTAVKLGKMLGAHGVILGTAKTYERGKVGISVRLVSVETGRQIWEASDAISSKDKRVQQVVEKKDRERLKDKDFLTSILCRLIVDTLK